MLAHVPLPSDVSLAPHDVLKMIPYGCSSNRPCSTMRCSCSAARLSCFMFCGCNGMEECQNEQTKSISAFDADDVSDPSD
jgi:hypothetical protein